MYDNKKTFILNKNTELFSETYVTVKHAYKILTKLLYDEIINQPEIITLYKDANSDNPDVKDAVRKQLHQRLQPTYERLKTLHLKQLHFHLPDVSSFLRLHKPSKYGDSLVGIRYSLELVNRDKQYVEGFEEGRVSNGFRHVYPLFDEAGNHLGSVETSLSSKALKAGIENTTGNILDFVVKRSLVHKKVWKDEQSNYQESKISSEYVHEKHTDFDKKALGIYQKMGKGLNAKTADLIHRGEQRSIYHRGYIVSFLPITNVQGEKAAAYLISFDGSNTISKLRDSYFFLLLFLTMGVSFTAIIFNLLLRKFMQIEIMATHDSLTQIFNRSEMTKRIEVEIYRLKRYKESLSILFLDIDHFKAVNDNYGHAKGDEVLKSVASLFKTSLRKTDIASRWGGEEFLVLLPHTNISQAVQVAEKLRCNIQEFAFSDGSIHVTCSFGVAESCAGESYEKVVDRADQKLYEAKESGRNRVCS